MLKEIFNILEKAPQNKKVMVITSYGDIFTNKNFLYSGDSKNKILTLEKLLNEPEKVWAFVLEKRKQLERNKLNDSYTSLVKLENFYQDNFSLITNNQDNFHQRSGNYRVIEIYGNLFKNKILNPNLVKNQIKEINYFPVNENNDLLRPDILLKGEVPERKKILQTHILAQQTDLLIIIGKLSDSNLSILPLMTKKFNNSQIIEINPYKQYCEIADLYIKMKKELILPLLTNIIIDIEIGLKNKQKFKK